MAKWPELPETHWKNTAPIWLYGQALPQRDSATGKLWWTDSLLSTQFKGFWPANMTGYFAPKCFHTHHILACLFQGDLALASMRHTETILQSGHSKLSSLTAWFVDSLPLSDSYTLDVPRIVRTSTETLAISCACLAFNGIKITDVVKWSWLYKINLNFLWFASIST